MHHFSAWYNFHDLSRREIFFNSLSQYLLWETCCKSYTNKSGTFLCKEVKFLPARHNFKFKCVKMRMFETHFKMFSSCFLHIQYVVTRNKFTSFRPWKLETLHLLAFKENLCTNLLRSMILSLMNKSYYYIVILFLVYVFPFVSKGFLFP